MRKLALIAALVITSPVAAYAGHSVTCSASSNGTVTCSYTYTW